MPTEGNAVKKCAFIILILLLALAPPTVAAVSMALPRPAQADTNNQGPYDRLGIALSACLAVGLAGIGAGIAISATGAAAISALAEKPETFFRSFLVVALAEAIAIYGMIIGILLWLKL